MSAYFHASQYQPHRFQPVDLAQLPYDLKRMLTVQLREFIHQVEDAEDQNELEHNPRVLSFLEHCYRKAA